MRILQEWAEKLDGGEPVELVQARASGGTAIVATLEDWDDATTLVAEALRKAQEDADAMGSRARYYLRCGENRSRHFNRTGARTGIADEREDSTKLIANLFTYTDKLQRLVLDMAERTASSHVETNKQMRKQLAHQEKTYLKVLALTEELLSQKQERENQQRREDAKLETLRHGGRQMLMYLPRLMRKFLGGAGKLDAESAPAFQQLREFTRQISPEETMRLMTVIAENLGPQRAEQLGDILGQFALDESEDDDDDATPAAPSE